MSRSRSLALSLPALLLTLAPLSAPGAEGNAGAKAPLTPSEAPGRMTLPEGFTSTMFAAEPDVHQPIAFAIDPRGRLWVAECYSYPQWTDGTSGNDRILILEDTDGDGRHDRRTVFADNIANISGLEVGFGGVWVCATPNFLFIPDGDGDDVPDGPPVVKLDGWDLKAEHNVFNGLTWGPDGWLWGCNGILSNSRVGRPGTPLDGRVPINCGVWRYHPTREVFEVVANGTTNPWGLDFDDYGEAFITNCVIPHLFRVVPGAHFQRMFGQDFNPHLYGLMESCADHIHWAGGRWQDSREGRAHGEAGGGHAHVGAMIYLGDNWPDQYRNGLFTCNVHGHRVNNDTLERVGSGYVARHAPDFLFANDDWFRGLELAYGPDGAVFVTDWSDTGECHENDEDGAHRENGRIFKVAHGTPRPVRVDLASLSDEELVALQAHRNDWFVRNARRLLQERAASGRDLGRAHDALRAMFRANEDVTRKLRALWALYVTGGLDADALRAQLDHPSEYVRAWAVRLLGDEGEPGAESLARFAEMAREDPSPLVRLYLASALQRVAPERRGEIVEGLIAHSESAKDRDLSLMIWYGIEPLVPRDLPGAAALAGRCRIPIVREFIARRAVTANPEAGLAALVPVLERVEESAVRHDLLSGMSEALRGRPGVGLPDSWPAAAERLARDADESVRERALLLAVRLGDQQASDALQRLLMDPDAPAERRQHALSALVEERTPGLTSRLYALLDDESLRGGALRALAAYEDEATPRVILDHYAALSPTERADAVATLAARPAYADALLDAVASGTVPRRDLSASIVRQLRALGDPQLLARIEEVWGVVRSTSREKAELLTKYRALLTPDVIGSADPSRGRLVFNRTCFQCHRLYDAGGDVGPELTGSDRANLDYILENVLDPGSTVGQDYMLTNVATTDGRLISGIIREQDEDTVVMQTANERIIVPRSEIEEMATAPESMMPEGLFEGLSDDELRDLVAYLASKQQVALPEGEGED